MLYLLFVSLIIIITIIILFINLSKPCKQCKQCNPSKLCKPCKQRKPQKPKHKKSWVKQDIINLYNNSKSFDDDGLPNGGLLVSLLSNSYASGVNIGYNTQDTNLDYPNNKKCYDNEISVPNLIDLNKLLVDTAKENLTNCFSLDTTYISFDAPGILFGPVLDNRLTVINMSIGLIFDINKLKKYIGCMFPADAGSVSRYNTKNKPSYYLNSQDLDNYDKLIRSDKGKALADAGCGLLKGQQYGNNRGGIYNTPDFGDLFPNSNTTNWYPMARYTINGDEQTEFPNIGGVTGLDPYTIGVIIDKDYNLNNTKYKDVDIFSSPNGWFNEIKERGENKYITFDNNKNKLNMFLTGTYGIQSQPYSRKSFEYFVNQIKNKYTNIFKIYGDNNLGKFFTNTYYYNIYELVNPYDIPNGEYNYPNFYYENEVDIYIPNTPETNKLSGTDVKKCDVQQDFLEVWKKCVIGIFTNHRCSEDIVGSSFQITNRETYSENKFSDFNDQIKNKLKEKNAYMLGKPSCTNEKPCCCSHNNYQILDKIVIELVKKWNCNNPDNPKINGYIMNDDMKLDGDTPSDFDTKKITKPLKIKQITDY